MKKTVLILSAVSVIALGLVSCTDRTSSDEVEAVMSKEKVMSMEQSRADSVSVSINPSDNDPGDKGSHMPPDD